MEKNILENVKQYQCENLNNNTYIIHCNNFAIIIDPSFNVDDILEFLLKNKITKICILLTHFHYDHIGKIENLIANFKGIKIYIGSAEKEYKNKQYSQFFDKLLDLNKKTDFFEIVFLEKEKEIIKFNDIELKAIHTPAHTIGSYTYNYKNLFFTGDFIFYDCIGFLDTNHEGEILFKKSINNLISYLNINSVICPGHNEIGTWEEVLKNNIELKTYGEIND